MLRFIADALGERREGVVRVASQETALSTQRLSSELTRTQYQLELFAQVLEEGSYLEPIIDHAAQTPMGPQPDVRRILKPIGPVAIFGASNFPFGFLCLVVTRRLRWLQAVRLSRGAPLAPRDLRDRCRGHPSRGERAGSCGCAGWPRFRSGGRQSSRHASDSSGGRLYGLARGWSTAPDVAATRRSPIPFYGELGALNAVLVLGTAAKERPRRNRGRTGSVVHPRRRTVLHEAWDRASTCWTGRFSTSRCRSRRHTRCSGRRHARGRHSGTLPGAVE